MKQILSFSLIIWILIDRFKGLWHGHKYSSYITSLIALLLGIAVAFLYQLDLVVALELTDEQTVLGYIFTGLAIMGGSSCINEILEKVANPFIDTDIKEG